MFGRFVAQPEFGVADDQSGNNLAGVIFDVMDFAGAESGLVEFNGGFSAANREPRGDGGFHGDEMHPAKISRNQFFLAGRRVG